MKRREEEPRWRNRYSKTCCEVTSPSRYSTNILLKNRNPKGWRDKIEIKNEHEGTMKVEMGDMEKWSN